MTPIILLLMMLLLSIFGYHWGRKRALAVAGCISDGKRLHSRPQYYGAITALWCLIPCLLIFAGWHVFESRIITHLVVSELPAEMRGTPEDRLNLIINDIRNRVNGNFVSGQADEAIAAAADHYRNLKTMSMASLTVVVMSVGVLGILFVVSRIKPAFRARNQVELLFKLLLIACSCIAILTTLGIVLSVLYEAIRFFRSVPLFDFLFGLRWSPQMAIRADQVGSSGAFGVVPVFVGTVLISAIAMLVAVPIGLMAAIYLSEYAGPKFRTVAKPLMEILAGIPTVVYGFFAALTVAPFIRDVGAALGFAVASESALAAGAVMGIMIIPFVSSISDDVINAVPQALRDGAYGLGATKSETIKQVVLPAALPGIVGGVLLAMSRAIGETMIVVMAAGLAANMTVNPLKAVTTVTVQIVTLLVGDQEFDSPKTLAAFALGLLLFLVTLVLNIIALYVVRKYREQYE
jgi:phosphate transport system permease protein